MTFLKTARGRQKSLPSLIKQQVPLSLDPVAYAGSIVLGTDDALYVSTGAGWLPVERGLSAYDIAVENGFVGTEAQWLETITEAANALAEQSALQSANSANTSAYWAGVSQLFSIQSANSANVSAFWASQAALTVNTALSYVASANATLTELNSVIDDTRIALFSLTIGFVNTQTRAIQDAIYFDDQITGLLSSSANTGANTSIETRLTSLEVAQAETDTTLNELDLIINEINTIITQ